MMIGNYNHSKIGSYVKNTAVQNCNIIDYKAKVINCFDESNDIMAPLSEIKEDKILRNNAIILSRNKIRYNALFYEEEYKKNIENLVGVLDHLFNASQTKNN